MSSFSMVLLEGGVDVEVDVDFADMTSIFDEEVPSYTCGEFGLPLRLAGERLVGNGFLWSTPSLFFNPGSRNP